MLAVMLGTLAGCASEPAEPVAFKLVPPERVVVAGYTQAGEGLVAVDVRRERADEGQVATLLMFLKSPSSAMTLAQSRVALGTVGQGPGFSRPALTSVLAAWSRLTALAAVSASSAVNHMTLSSPERLLQSSRQGSIAFSASSDMAEGRLDA